MIWSLMYTPKPGEVWCCETIALIGFHLYMIAAGSASPEGRFVLAKCATARPNASIHLDQRSAFIGVSIELCGIKALVFCGKALHRWDAYA